MEDSFGINDVALVDGQPRTLGLKELLEVYLEHRYDVVRRRSQFRRDKAADRLHLVEGLLLAILDIDEVIQLIRASDDAAAAKERLIDGLRPHRDPGRLHPRHAAAPADQVLPDRAGEGAGRAARARSRSSTRSWTTRRCSGRSSPTSWPRWPRPTAPRAAPCCSSRPAPTVTAAARRSRSPTTRASCCSRPPGCWPAPPATSRSASGGGRAKHDVVVSAVPRTARGQVGLSPARGRLRQAGRARPARAPGHGQRPPPAGRPAGQRVRLARARRAGAGADHAAHRRARARAGHPRRRRQAGQPRGARPGTRGRSIRLDDGDEVVGAVELATGDETLCFVTSDAQLLHFAAGAVRPQGRAGGGMAGIRLAAGRAGRLVRRRRPPTTPSWSPSPGSSTALPGTEPGASRSTPFAEYPGQGPRPPAACAATASSRARTPSSPPGPAPRRPGRPRPAARRSTCRGRPAGATAPGCPGRQPIAAVRRAGRPAAPGPHGGRAWRCGRLTPCRPRSRPPRRGAGRLAACWVWRLAPWPPAAATTAAASSRRDARRRSWPRPRSTLDDTSGVELALTTEDLPDGVTGSPPPTGTGTHAAGVRRAPSRWSSTA